MFIHVYFYMYIRFFDRGCFSAQCWTVTGFGVVGQEPGNRHDPLWNHISAVAVVTWNIREYYVCVCVCGCVCVFVCVFVCVYFSSVCVTASEIMWVPWIVLVCACEPLTMLLMLLVMAVIPYDCNLVQPMDIFNGYALPINKWFKNSSIMSTLD